MVQNEKEKLSIVKLYRGRAPREQIYVVCITVVKNHKIIFLCQVINNIITIKMLQIHELKVIRNVKNTYMW